MRDCVHKNEAGLKSAAMKELHKQLPAFLVLALADAGGPDKTVVGAGRTTFWEFKHATPDFTSHDNQALLCTRLAVQGYCRYVIWQEHHGIKRTLIVHPRAVLERDSWAVVPESFTTGFDHRWLVEQVRKAHRI